MLTLQNPINIVESDSTPFAVPLLMVPSLFPSLGALNIIVIASLAEPDG